MKSAIKKFGVAASGVALAAALAGSAIAEPNDNQLTIEGEPVVTDVKAPEGSPFETLYSGWRYRMEETQDLERDDFENPAFVGVGQAEEQYQTVEGSEGKACANCHEDISQFKGLRAGLPRWNEYTGKPETLEHIINECRTERMGAEAWKWEASQMVNMTALIGLQSRGLPVAVQTDGPMAEWAEKGKELYYTRVGQLNMACSSCHEDNAGIMIRADHLSQGHINGFPVYRLKWGGMGSIHRRFKGCMDNIRAVPYKRGSDEFIALELYVASRGTGLSVESPAVRN